LDVPIEKVKELRSKTGAGLLDCKKALMESNGDFEKAIEYLRKKGSLTAQKRVDKIAKEGLILARTSENKNAAGIIEVNCETDFVARSAEFQEFANAVLESVLKAKTGKMETILDSSSEGKSIKNRFDELLAKVGEKIEIKRADYFNSDGGFFCVYNHVGNKIASVVELTGAVSEKGLSLGNDLAMQVAAMKPIAVDRNGISRELIDKEKEIYLTQAKNEKKPDNVAEKIAANKVEKFYQENCLVDQEFIREPGKSVADIIRTVSKEANSDYSVRHFIRFQLGETLTS
jgi:elongation factor Ts